MGYFFSPCYALCMVLKAFQTPPKTSHRDMALAMVWSVCAVFSVPFLNCRASSCSSLILFSPSPLFPPLSPVVDDDQWTGQRRDATSADVQWSPSSQDISLISEDYFPIYFVAPGIWLYENPVWMAVLLQQENSHCDGSNKQCADVSSCSLCITSVDMNSRTLKRLSLAPANNSDSN